MNCTQRNTEDDHPILRKEVEVAGQSLKKRKSAGVDNIPAQLVQVGGEESKKEGAGCEVICGTPTTPTVKGWAMGE